MMNSAPREVVSVSVPERSIGESNMFAKEEPVPRFSILMIASMVKTKPTGGKKKEMAALEFALQVFWVAALTGKHKLGGGIGQHAREVGVAAQNQIYRRAQ